MLNAERGRGVVVHGRLVRGERGRGYFGVAVSEDEQRNDPEHGEQHLLEMRISRVTRTPHKEKTKRRENEEDEEINVFTTHLVRYNKSLR